MRIGNRGEVWFVLDEVGKERPYVIVTNENTLAEIDHSIVKVTSHEVRNQFDIPIEDLETAGLNRPSIVRCSKLMTIHQNLLRFKVGNLSEQDFNRVISTIKEYFS